jgi:flagellar hook-associated protein 1 FlgK
VSIFSGIELLRRALGAQQVGMDVAGHNVANVNTPGFSRQEVVHAAVPPPGATSRFATTLLTGGGVQVAAVRRARDAFLERQLQEARQALAEWRAREDFLAQVEAVFPEPSDSGLAQILSAFWNAWQELSLDPTSNAARVALVQQAQAVVDALHQSRKRLEELRGHLDAVAVGHVQRINQIASEIASLNTQISRLEVRGQPALDLRDRREALLGELRELADVIEVESEAGELLVFLQGRELVGPAGRTTEIQITPDPTGVHTFTWPDGATLDVRKGALAAVLRDRDQDVGGLVGRLDALAGALIAQVNAKHATGYGLDGSTGVAFFTGVDALTIEVNTVIRTDPRKIAASSAPGEPGNGAQALAIAQLRGLSEIDGAYHALVAEIGVRAQEAGRQVANQELLADQLRLRREATSGVSIDEEMANMLRYQHAYDAAARMIRAIDEMIRTVLDIVGG